MRRQQLFLAGEWRDGADEIEVGSYYAEFFSRLVRWTMGEDRFHP